MRLTSDVLSRDDAAYESGRRSRASSSRSATGRRRPNDVYISYDRERAYDVQPVHSKRLFLVGGVAILACILAIFVAVPLINAEPSPSSGLQRVTNEVSVADKAEKAVNGSESVVLPGEKGSYTPDAADVMAIPGSKDVISIDLKDGSSAAADNGRKLGNVRSAIAAIEETDDCGFVFFDADTGLGLAYNADEVMYVASAAKAPFVYWLLSTNTSLDEYEDEEVEWIIEESDNGSFEDLFPRYYSDGYVDMMESYKVQHEDYYGDYYPRMGARTLAAIWTDMLRYLQGGQKNAKWLASLLKSTETSFIRDGLSDEGVTVMNKAGWIDEEEYRSVTDAGIIQANDRTYIMVIVTTQIDGGEAEENVSVLARALFDARTAL